jgi:hypothetical protein
MALSLGGALFGTKGRFFGDGGGSRKVGGGLVYCFVKKGVVKLVSISGGQTESGEDLLCLKEMKRASQIWAE